MSMLARHFRLYTCVFLPYHAVGAKQVPSATQVAGILFADIVGFSKLKDDKQVLEVQTHLSDFVEKHTTPTNRFFKNTWGDAVVLASSDPSDSLGHAIRLRDWFKNRNWRRSGITEAIQIRIGLHSERLTVLSENGIITNICGKHVSSAARIEPIVPPGRIYCSESFYVLVRQEASGFVTFVDLGDKELAKSFGQMRLYEISATSGAQEPAVATNEPAFGFSIPKVRKEFSDSEKADFLEKGFDHVCDYILKVAVALPGVDSDLEAKARKIAGNKLIVEVFVKGKLKAKGQFWMSMGGYFSGIHFSQSIQTADNSYNESFAVNTDGFTLSLRPSMSLRSSSEGLSYQQAAEACWKLITDQLQY